MTAVGLPPATREAVLTAWLENRDLASVHDDWPIVWLSQEIAMLGEPCANLSVVWNGRLDVPRDGEYRFSTSPINVNVRIGAHYVRQACACGSAANRCWTPPGPSGATKGLQCS